MPNTEVVHDTQEGWGALMHNAIKTLDETSDPAIHQERQSTISKIAIFFPYLLKPRDFDRLVEDFYTKRNTQTFDDTKPLLKQVSVANDNTQK